MPQILFVDSSLLGEKIGQLADARQWPPRVVDTLSALITAGEDHELFRINPIQYALNAGITPGEAIDLFLHAVKLGIVEMDWQIVCDQCGGVVSRLEHLKDVHSAFSCPGCSNHGPTTLDDVIRVSFTVSPQIRPIAFHHPEALSGEDLTKYQATCMLGPRRDDAAFYSSFLSGKRLLTTQTFRNLFRSEIVDGDEEIDVRDITIMFTDLKGSTAMYDKIGDPKAFYLVRQHFETLRSVVVRYEGATIKTIGDAVMATFFDPLDGVAAALQMLVGIDEFNKTISEKLILKIGLHRGHSIAVTLDERQDYFGQTVNIAARVQGLAGPGEVYITQAMKDHPGVEKLLEESWLVAPEEAALKGISEKVKVYKLTRRKN